MKKIHITAFFLLISFIGLYAQDQIVPATIVLKDNSKITCYHFAQNECSKKSYFQKYISIKGFYEGQTTEIKKYDDIKKMVLIGFKEDAVFTGENEQGTILVHMKNGVEVQLDNATINLSCYGVNEKHNQLKVQMKNPLNNQIFDKAVDTKDIQYIVFQ